MDSSPTVDMTILLLFTHPHFETWMTFVFQVDHKISFYYYLNVQAAPFHTLSVNVDHENLQYIP